MPCEAYMNNHCPVMLGNGAELWLHELVRANRRHTRLVVKAELNQEPVYVKIYRGALGRWKSSLTERKAIKLRRRLPDCAPPLLYAGVLTDDSRAIVYAAIDGAITLDWLKVKREPTEGLPTVQQLVHVFAYLHQAGIRQTDTNLTNFIVSNGRVIMLDDDDLRFQRRPVGLRSGLRNLASLLARLQWLNRTQLFHCFDEYIDVRGSDTKALLHRDYFLTAVAREQQARREKHG